MPRSVKVSDNNNHLLTLNPQENFKSLGKFTSDRGNSRGILSYISYIGRCHPKDWLFEPFWSENQYDFDHYSLKLGIAFKGTTRAYKRIKYDMFWSEIASRFKKPNVTPLSTNVRTTPAYRADPGAY